MPLIKEHKKPPSVIDSDRGRYSCSRGKSRKKNTCIIPRPGGKEKEKMEFEILNEAHRIIAVKPEFLPGCLFCYIPVLDVIVLDAAARSKDGLAELMEVYLELPDQAKKETKAYAAKNKTIQEYLSILDQIARMRRRLYKSRWRR